MSIIHIKKKWYLLYDYSILHPAKQPCIKNVLMIELYNMSCYHDVQSTIKGYQYSCFRIFFLLFLSMRGLYDRWASQHIGMKGVSLTGTLTLDIKWMDD